MMLRVIRLQVNLLVSGGGTPEDQGPAAAPDHQSRRQQRQLTGQVIAVEAAQCREVDGGLHDERRHRHDDTRLHEGYAHLVGRPVEGQQEQIQQVLTAGDLMEMRQVVRDIPVSAAVEEYALALVIGTHPDSEYAVKEVKQYVLEGASPRAAQAILLTAKARALLDGRYNVSFDDIDDVAKAALRHRLALNFDALSENIVADTIIAALQEALNGRKTV